ncbi:MULTISPECIES: DUF1611 domain-containing protein [Trichocoleus]|uniref:DUF1611 domain-containing protein n=1 Tax=Trichocoleus desertorum GB2-A4 TaxID=2933944 RepID=A0ABV0J7U2_9CYAN|nr:DUF1611 domain-containing protein [Trichocoleus sp. FACHB-46]MBD1862193.1 DUF1611 domain-containing protein [Trichocoleus sp. FACHB-46]
MRLSPEHRVAILLHDGIRGSQGKTGLSLLRYSDANIVAVIDQQCAGESLLDLTGIHRTAPIVASVAESLTYKPDVLAIGIAPSGGILPEAWRQEIQQAIAAGVSVANGLHTPLAEDPELKALLCSDQWIWDMRQEPTGLTVGTGAARSLNCLRVLLVGTDMSVGKMSTALELHQTALQRGLRAKFLATGQAGMMLAGDGIPLDAIRVDFASGAVEQLVLRLGADQDIVFVEGQGSLLNPASTATLPLLRGSQPTHLVLVHRAGQTHIRNFTHVPIPPLRQVVELYETVATAGGAFAPAKVVAIALNTAHLDTASAKQAIEQTQQETSLPCTDPVRFRADLLLDAILGDR